MNFLSDSDWGVSKVSAGSAFRLRYEILVDCWFGVEIECAEREEGIDDDDGTM